MCRKAFLLLLLAASWLSLPPLGQEVQVLELFAGKRRLSRLAKGLGYGVAAHDITYDNAATSQGRSSMDFNQSGGFTWLVM